MLHEVHMAVSIDLREVASDLCDPVDTFRFQGLCSVCTVVHMQFECIWLFWGG